MLWFLFVSRLQVGFFVDRSVEAADRCHAEERRRAGLP